MTASKDGASAAGLLAESGKRGARVGGANPIGRVVTRSGSPEERPALFAAQFSLSHAWLATYPIAGVLGSVLGLAATASILAGVAAAAVLAGALAWRAEPMGSARPTRVAAQRA